MQVWTLASFSGLKRYSIATSCSIGHRWSLDLVLLWLWCRWAAATLILPLDWDFHMLQVRLFKKERKRKRKKKERKMEKKKIFFSYLFILFLGWKIENWMRIRLNEKEILYIWSVYPCEGVYFIDKTIISYMLYCFSH